MGDLKCGHLILRKSNQIPQTCRPYLAFLPRESLIGHICLCPKLPTHLKATCCSLPRSTHTVMNLILSHAHFGQNKLKASLLFFSPDHNCLYSPVVASILSASLWIFLMTAYTWTM